MPFSNNIHIHICSSKKLFATLCHGQILQTIPEDFSLFVRLWASKTKEDSAQSCPMGLSGETVGSDLLNSDSVKSRLRWLKNKVGMLRKSWSHHYQFVWGYNFPNNSMLCVLSAQINHILKVFRAPQKPMEVFLFGKKKNLGQGKFGIQS